MCDIENDVLWVVYKHFIFLLLLFIGRIIIGNVIFSLQVDLNGVINNNNVDIIR